VQQAVQKIKPDLVYHLAAQSSVPDSWKEPAKTFEVNVLGTIHLVEALKANQKKCTLLVVESGEVYGKGERLTEESPLSPQNPYAASKAAQDLALYPYLQNPFLKIIRVRPFNHIGPGQDTRFAVAHFAYQIAAIEAKKMPPEIHVGNLKPKRDFTDVRDVVRAYQLLAKKGKAGEVYNLCSEKLVSIERILKKLLSFSREKIKIKIDPQFCRKNDILWIAASAKKLKKTTGWEPQIPLEQSLIDTLNFFREEFK
jgi:GDP-4-dehydro-6-deoxy-D-mannose reductase